MSNNQINSIELVEKIRLAALRHLKILDSPFETAFDTLTTIASKTCNVPTAFISLVDEHREWLIPNIDVPSLTDAERCLEFCTQTVKTADILEVKDASKDERFSNNPLVTGRPNIRYYAGVPITLPMGETIGTFCVIDIKPNQLDQSQKDVLLGLSKLVSQLIIARNLNLNTQPLSSEYNARK
jgi:GAF domain-containing protein